VLQDWKYVASVIDRIQLVIFSSVTIVGTVAILMNAPFILDFVDQDAIIKRLTDKSVTWSFLAKKFWVNTPIKYCYVTSSHCLLRSFFVFCIESS
uniref:Anoctamin n=1 Tax=Macrostomum lignano TaxID=282301 RepID=A0A1I8HTX8_9PLAT